MDTLQLRKFGFILIGMLSGLFGLLFPLLGDRAIPTWPWALAAILAIPTLFQPRWLNSIYQPWMKLGHILGWVNTRIILGLIFFLMITPMGMIMRWRGKDPMQRQFEKEKPSYRKATPAQPPQHMEKPF